MKDRTFPVMFHRSDGAQLGPRRAAPSPVSIPWSVAELAYSVYVDMFGDGQTLEQLAARGGFGPSELDAWLPDWRERAAATTALKARVDELEQSLRDVAIPTLKHCEEKFGLDDQARLNCEAALGSEA